MATEGAYGFSEQFLNANPTIRDLVDRAVSDGYTTDKFMDEIRKTAWWKKRTDTQKQFDVERAENPAQVARTIAQMSMMIRNMATRMGFSTTSAVLAAKRLAERAVRDGWSEEEIRVHVGARFSHGGEQSGIIGQTKADLKEMANSYGQKVQNATLNDITRAVLQGIRTTEDYEGFFREQAKRQYSGIASQLDAGFTVRQILDPYLAQAAEELGVAPSAMNITDTKWTAPISYIPKGEKVSRAMTMDEWTARYRTDTRYGFDKGQTSQRVAAQFSNELMSAFGAMG